MSCKLSVRLLLPFAFALFAATPACTRDHYVRGPDGEEAHVISCSRPERCYARAAELCPDGYVIRTREGSVYVGNPGGPRSKASLLVSCKSDLGDGDGERPVSDEERACAVAFRQAADFAAYYAQLEPGSVRLEALPSQRDFVSVCKRLPENVRSCLEDKHREESAKACDAVMTRLERGDRDRLDGLFLAAVRGDGGAPR